MKNFLIKSLFFFIGIPIAICIVYIGMDKYYNDFNEQNAIFIWGDSQAYRGIDLDLLKANTGKNVYSAAQHGAGAYDFLVFAEKVPTNSVVIISPSKPSLIRKKDRDRNRSSLNLSSLFTLLKHNYKFSEVCIIAENNKKPNKIFSSSNEIYPYSDTLVLDEPIELIEEVYEEKPYYLNDKMEIIQEGIKILTKKNCSVNIVLFPFHHTLREIEIQSPIKAETDFFYTKLANDLEFLSTDTVYLDEAKPVMYDLTHLNKHGVDQTTKYIASRLLEKKKTSFFINIESIGSNK